ncbi:MAG: HNH endonuclease signature motif containing protein [bacterium]
MKAILRGELDVGEFDSEFEFVLALQIPDHVESCDGTTGRSVFVEYFKWNVSDVAFLVGDNMPIHHPSISEAGFSKKDLLRLANLSHSAVDYIEGLETYAGYKKGHYLGSQGNGKLRELEKSFAAKVRLTQKRDQLADYLRTPHKVLISISSKVRNEVLQDHDYTCIFCGKARPDVQIQAHHVIPKSIIKKLQMDEGLYTCRWNLVCACVECNQAKSDTLAIQDLRFLIKQIESGTLVKNRMLLPNLRKFENLR